jgi:predicted flap endonuclease-1-like 5' DNA nuclease
MTKKTVKKSANKTAKKVTEDKILSAKTLKKIDSKLMSTKEELENQVEDLSSQVKKLSKKSGKKALKLLKKLDASYHRRLVHLQSEFEEGLASLSKVQDTVLERLPNFFSDKSNSTTSKTAKSTKAANLEVKTPVSKPRPKVAIKKSNLSLIKGIGPVMEKKLAEEGITTLSDIANTPRSKIDVLKKFEKERGFNTWKEQAKALLAK